MANRSYSNYSSMRDCAAEIVRDCILYGRSDGWSGSLEDLEKLEEICGRFNVIYADDFRGSWEPKAN